MNAANANSIYVIDGSAGITPPANPTGTFRRRIKKNNSQPVVDVIVVLVALPSLTILALLLEANTRGNWLETSRSRYTVLGLGLTLAAVCLGICMYVTSRIGGKMWSGAIPSDGSSPAFSYYNSRSTADEMNDLPPSYDIVMSTGFDIPPPPYHAVVIENEAKSLALYDECPKYVAIQHI